MKINLSQKEYRLLLEMLYLADWILHSHVVRDDCKNLEYQALKDKLLAIFKESDADLEHEGAIHKYIKGYDDRIFWQALIDRLSERDAMRENGIEVYRSMNGIDRIIKLDEIKTRYVQEFENQGLERLQIIEGSRK